LHTGSLLSGVHRVCSSSRTVVSSSTARIRSCLLCLAVPIESSTSSNRRWSMQLDNQVHEPPQVHPEPRSESRIERTATGALRVVTARGATLARAVRCFPWSEPRRHISIRDSEGNELLYVDDPRRLDESSRQALESALTTAGFVIDVTG